MPRTLDTRVRWLLILLGLVILFLCGQAGITLYYTARAQQEGRDLIERYLPAMRAAGNLQMEMVSYHAANLESIFAQNSEQMAERERLAAERYQGIEINVINIRPLLENVHLRLHFDGFEEALGTYVKTIEMVRGHLLADRTMEAFTLYDRDFANHYTAAVKHLQGIRYEASLLSDAAAKRAISGLEKTRKITFFISALAGGLALLSLGGIGVGREVRRLAVELQQSEQLLSEKNTQIMQSINYAHLIQRTVFTELAAFSGPEAEAFSLVLPRDVVSGDFHWFGQKGGCYLAAVVDCTGHGVPGAFISLIGHLVLDEILATSHELDPGKILSRYHSRVRQVLRQEAPEANKDGMDVALWIYEPGEQQVKFAGARRPLYLVPAGQPLIEIKGNRQSVGGGDSEHLLFDTHQVAAPAGTHFYLMTDGLADQPNLENKRLGSIQVKSLLAEVAPLPLNQQQAKIQAALARFSAGTPQRDDLSLIGIRVGRA
jgi:serine phosphatase RsbU (regulator of sigma subunit)